MRRTSLDEIAWVDISLRITLELCTESSLQDETCYSGTSLKQTPSGPTKGIPDERVSSGQGFIICYIWDSVSVI